jgi:RNA polymerase sigma factor (sigma-70 family)
MPDADHGGRFATTRWSLVLAAGRHSNPRSADALASLCEMYWYPVYALVRHQGLHADEAADITQEFFARVLQKNYFQDADPARGRFRAFLSVAVRHFLSNQRDRERALKRGGDRPPISLEVETAEGRYQLEPRDGLTPEKLFDRRWAMILLDRALGHVRDEYTKSGRSDLFGHLHGVLTGDAGGVPYSEIARTTGMSEGAVKVAVHRLRRRFREALVAEIAETVSNHDDIDAEIRYLLNAVSM